MYVRIACLRCVYANCARESIHPVNNKARPFNFACSVSFDFFNEINFMFNTQENLSYFLIS